MVVRVLGCAGSKAGTIGNNLEILDLAGPPSSGQVFVGPAALSQRVSPSTVRNEGISNPSIWGSRPWMVAAMSIMKTRLDPHKALLTLL